MRVRILGFCVIAVLLAHCCRPADIGRAARRGDLRAVQRLLDRGADVNTARRGDGRTLLHLAVGTGDYAMVRFLLDQRADTEVADRRGQTPLHAAALNGQSEIATLLVHRGADTGAGDAAGDTPLHLACVGGTEATGKVAAALLDGGANANAPNWYGRTPLQSVVEEQARWTAWCERRRDAAGAREGQERLAQLHKTQGLLEWYGADLLQPEPRAAGLAAPAAGG